MSAAPGAGWGSLWGLALGAWLLAPEIIHTHHIRPESATQWTVLVLGLAALFAALGAFLGFITGFLLAALSRGTSYGWTWAYGLSAGVLVVAAYALEGLLIHWISFRSLGNLPYAWVAGALAIAGATAAGVFAVITRGAWKLRPVLGPVVLAWVLGGVALGGIIQLPVRLAPSLPPIPEVGPLNRSPAHDRDVPLLFIGLDGATWRLLDPAMASGAAPTLGRLVDRGTRGTVEALWPPYWSGAAWASIVTGLPREVTGVHEDLAATAPGLPVFQVPLSTTPRLNPFYTMRAFLVTAGIVRYTPPSRPLLRGTPVWQLLHEAGVDAAVVRFRFTYPPADQAGIVVSDWVGRDQWDKLGVHRPDPSSAVTPPELAERLLSPFGSERIADPDLLTRLLGGPRPPRPADALADPIEELALAADIDDRTFDVAELILRDDPRQPFLAVYVGGLDSVEHAFWQYRFPDDFPLDRPSAESVERLGPALDRYVEYVDERLSRLLALYGDEVNVVIVSDHGMGATTISSDWRGWHAKDGIFLAAGPSVPHQPAPVDVSYLDVLPTLVQLAGFAKPASLAGRSVVPEASKPAAIGTPDGN